MSDADVLEWLAERGVTVAPSTVSDWVRTFPRCITAARTHRATVGQRWRVDETSITVATRWHELFRAIDDEGQIVDVYLSDRRHAAAAQACCEAARTSTTAPTRVTSDQATSYPPAVRAGLPTVEQRTSKDLTTGWNAITST